MELPPSITRGTIHEAVFEGTVREYLEWPSDDATLCRAAVTLRRDVNRYIVEYGLSPKFGEIPKAMLGYHPIAAKRGVLEYIAFPSRLAELSRGWLEGGLTRPRYRLVPHVPEDTHTDRGSPFAPAGRWEKLPNSPTDFTLRARLVIEESIVPDSFTKSLNRLAYHTSFETLTIRYEPHPHSRTDRSEMTSRDAI